MGYIQEVDSLVNIIKHEQRINKQFKKSIGKLGWEEVSYNFNLGHVNKALDVFHGSQRYLIYPTSVDDKDAFNLLTSQGLPHFDITYNPQSTLALAAIPSGTRPMDMFSFPDQEPTSSYMGSHELLLGIADFLSKLYGQTQHLPPILRLSDLAYIPNSTDYIRLIPPLFLINSEDWTPLVDDLKDDLTHQDPGHSHDRQIHAFQEYFRRLLQNDQ
jgi:hypothetical protein